MAETDFYTTINNPQLAPNPTRFYTNFLYKAVFLSVFLLVLPLVPSQAPDFINQTINTRSWELLQLLFVGIAVSYGLFSKRNDETEKEQGSTKSDNAQSYVARLLQVSSVFDDDSENPSLSQDNSKVQAWSSQYYRGEPIVVVAKESSVLDEHGGGGGVRTVEKPRLLPVRSLKNGVSESSMAVSRSNSRRFSRSLSKSSGLSPDESEENPEENVVLRSPIPWRSRSGRMEVKEDAGTPPLFSQTPSMEDSSEINRSFRYQSSKSPKPISNPLSQTKIHPSSPSLSSEIQSKSIEDAGRKKITHRSSLSPTPHPPPSPPPPPPRPLVNSNYTQNTIYGYSGRELRRTTRSFPNKFSEDSQNEGRTGAEFTIRTRSDISSFRTPKEAEFDEYLTDDKEIERFIERRGSQNKKFMNENTQTFTEYPKEEKKEFIKSIAMKTGKDSDESEEEEDDDDEEQDDDDGGGDELQELAAKPNVETVGKDSIDTGPDVDKKADEFIAKFREQIRLQRIASIRRSTSQAPRNGVR